VWRGRVPAKTRHHGGVSCGRGCHRERGALDRLFLEIWYREPSPTFDVAESAASRCKATLQHRELLWPVDAAHCEPRHRERWLVPSHNPSTPHCDLRTSSPARWAIQYIPRSTFPTDGLQHGGPAYWYITPTPAACLDPEHGSNRGSFRL
jgi:hypothetical protein